MSNRSTIDRPKKKPTAAAPLVVSTGTAAANEAIPKLLSTAALAEHLPPQKKGRPITEQAVRLWRVKGCGPRFLKIAGHCYYDPADVRAWLESRKASSTAELKARRRGARRPAVSAGR